jgi:CBS domain containing-hemolysin-like protein
MEFLLFTLGVFALIAGLVVFSYLDRIYRELGRVTTGRVHANLDIIEVDVEPHIRMERRSAALTFGILANLWLVLTVLVSAAGVNLFVPNLWEAALELVFLLTAEVVLGVYFLPFFLLTRTTGRWLVPLLPVLRIFIWTVWPLRAIVDLATSLAHLAQDEEPDAVSSRRAGQEGIEALVEAAEEEGILKREHAEMIEQMVEFGDKRVREVMTPRPDIVAIPANANVEQLRRLLVETKFSRIPVYESSLDEIIGIALARDVLHISERDAPGRNVRDLVRPALFVPETKLGSQLLKEMQQKRQQMAIVVDEYGTVAGLVTAEDLVEEIVGEMSEEDRAPVPDVVREADGGVLLRGSVSLAKVGDLLGVELDRSARDPGSTTIAGLLNAVAGHVPLAGEVVEYDGLRFEVLEANQRKVLRLRARRSPTATGAAGA